MSEIKDANEEKFDWITGEIIPPKKKTWKLDKYEWCPLHYLSNSFTYKMTLKNGDSKTISIRDIEFNEDDAIIVYDISWSDNGPALDEGTIKLSEVDKAYQVFIHYEQVSPEKREDNDFLFTMNIPNGKNITVGINKNDFVCIMEKSYGMDKSEGRFGHIIDMTHIGNPIDSNNQKYEVSDNAVITFVEFVCFKGIYRAYKREILTSDILGIFRYGINVTRFVYNNHSNNDNKSIRTSNKNKNKIEIA